MSALWFRAAVVGAAVAVCPGTAWCWGTAEHQQIGRTSYLEACTQIAAAVAALKPPPSGIATRLEVACGRNVDAHADIYGVATALAGDYLANPSEFVSQAGAWRFKSNKSYYLLALENSEHFNPMSTRSWEDYHGKAIEEALAGARVDGLDSVRRFQFALQQSAFADHFLHDSFSAGHMGFNRTASSAAASKAFHDAWNARGRIVVDRNGDRWVTFGDGWLDRPENESGLRHVQDAATMSVRNVIRAFVFGERAPDEELALWRALPFMIQAPEMKVDVVDLFTRKDDSANRHMVPLVTTIRPARKDTVASVCFWSAAPFSNAGDRVAAATGGLDLAVPHVPAQVYIGAGGTLVEPGGAHSVVVDTGLLFPLGIGLSGLVSVQLNATVSWLFPHEFATVIHGEAQMNLEFGNFLINLRGGLAEFLPHPRTGWYGAFGIGYTFTAAGGGTI